MNNGLGRVQDAGDQNGASRGRRPRPARRIVQRRPFSAREWPAAPSTPHHLGAIVDCVRGWADWGLLQPRSIVRRGCSTGHTYYPFHCQPGLFWFAIKRLCVHRRFVTFSGAIWQGFWGGLQGVREVHPEDSLIGSMTSSGIPSILGSSHDKGHGEPNEDHHTAELAPKQPHGNDMPCTQSQRSRGRGRRGSTNAGRSGTSRPPSSRLAAARATQSIRSLLESSPPSARGRKKCCTAELGHLGVSDDRVCLPPVDENSWSRAVGEQGGGARELQVQPV